MLEPPTLTRTSHTYTHTHTHTHTVSAGENKSAHFSTGANLKKLEEETENFHGRCLLFIVYISACIIYIYIETYFFNVASFHLSTCALIHPHSHNSPFKKNNTVARVDRSFSVALQQARLGKGLSQKELATRICEKPQVINEYESGKAIPNPNIINKLDRALGVHLPRGKKK
jgi:DNA-binding XRE family transcriptional regulator